MDPLANKREQMLLASIIIKQIDNDDIVDEIDVNRLCELVMALAGWENW